jgi:uncharacterized protein YdhG (YjbR/CyaY superfamily)
MDKTSFASIDEYIATFPEETQKLLQQVRETVRAAAPEAKEKISYQIPTFALNGNLVSFAAFKKHIGMYPIPAGTEEFQQQVAGYKAAKSSLHFPLDQPLPLELIRQLVQFRVAETQKNTTQPPARKKRQTGKTQSND